MIIKVDNYKKVMLMGDSTAQLFEEEIKEFDIASNRVLVKVTYSAVSPGTEFANLTGDKNINATCKAEDTVLVWPRGVGYSSSGVVVAVGSEVDDLQVGDRVVMRGCGHASHHVVSREGVYKIPYDDIGLDEISMALISSFSISGVRKLRIEAGESAAVMGCGILGLFAVQFCAAMGATPVIAVDPVKEKREKALELGADYAVDPFSDDFEKTMRSLTDGRGINAAVEVTGTGKALDQILDCMARHGRISLLGCTRNSNFTIDYYRKIHYPGIELIGAHTGTRPDNDSRPGFWTYADDYHAIFRLIHFGKVNYKKMISEIHPISECSQVYSRLANDYKNFPTGLLFDWDNA
mgnify:FL=1